MAVENYKGDRFDYPNESFGCPHEVEQYVIDKNVASCGTHWDLFSVMVVMGKGAQSGKDLSDKKYSASRVQLTVKETDLKGAMTHCLLACLFAKKAELLVFWRRRRFECRVVLPMPIGSGMAENHTAII
mmetsp:Transcript_5276/g.8130  ORF Transcript_5276/g.8130 Transcript_5276/m.8130 type:complete len:129 (+) Transcript_5276:172-558(+)